MTAAKKRERHFSTRINNEEEERRIGEVFALFCRVVPTLERNDGVPRGSIPRKQHTMLFMALDALERELQAVLQQSESPSVTRRPTWCKCPNGPDEYCVDFENDACDCVCHESDEEDIDQQMVKK